MTTLGSLVHLLATAGAVGIWIGLASWLSKDRKLDEGDKPIRLAIILGEGLIFALLAVAWR